MMKYLIAVFVLIGAAFGQGGRYDNIAIGPKGAIGGATIAVCSQPANSTVAPCTPLITTYTDVTLATPCNGLNGCSQPPFLADKLGNFHFYAQANQRYTVQVFGPKVSAPYVLADQAVPNAGTSTATAPFVSNNANPAATGLLRGANTDQVCWRNAANTADLCIGPTPGNVLSGASSLWAGVDFAAAISGIAFNDRAGPISTSGFVNMKANDSLCWRNAANTGDVCIFKNGSDQLVGPGLGGLWANILAGTNANAGTFAQSGNTWDFSAVLHALAFPVGLTAAKPATCKQGEEYFATDATAGANVYLCTAPNTWTQLTGGGQFYQTVDNAGTPLAQQPTLNFAGTGISCVNNAGSSRTDCTVTAGTGTANPAFMHASTSSTTPALACNSATTGTLDFFPVTMNANVTSLANPTTCTPGQDILIAWTQGGSGGFTVSGIGAAIKNLQQPTTTAAAVTYQVFRLDNNGNFQGFPASDSLLNALVTNLKAITITATTGNITTVNATTVNGTNGAFTSLTVNGVPIVPANVPQTYTTSHTISQATDNGALIEMNCSSPCTLTLDGSPAAGEYFAVQSIGAAVATVALNGHNYNQAASPPPLVSFVVTAFQWDAVASSWEGQPPPVAGANVSISPSSSGIAFSSTGGPGGGGQIDYPSNYPVRFDPFGLTTTSQVNVGNSSSLTSLIGSFYGRNVIPAGSMLPYMGGTKTIKFTGRGVYSTAASLPTLTLGVYINGTVINSFSVPIAVSASSWGWSLDFYVTVLSPGTLQYSGCVHAQGTSNADALTCAASSIVSGLNFAADQTVDVKVQWNTISASDNITAGSISVTAFSVF